MRAKGPRVLADYRKIARRMANFHNEPPVSPKTVSPLVTARQ
jgi:hypothetical protein